MNSINIDRSWLTIVVLIFLWLALGLYAGSPGGHFDCQMDDVRPRSCETDE